MLPGAFGVEPPALFLRNRRHDIGLRHQRPAEHRRRQRGQGRRHRQDLRLPPRRCRGRLLAIVPESHQKMLPHLAPQLQRMPTSRRRGGYSRVGLASA